MSAADGERFLRGYIQSVCTHYGEQIHSWDVVNATIDPTSWLAPEPVPARFPEPAGDAAELLNRRNAVLARAQEHYYEQPPHIERGIGHSLHWEDPDRFVELMR